ncbi:RNA polymerase sigma factor FliA [Buttiauxella warmboldiae]|uniref:RNA polymerase sigma factor FliA n=1 Tax=Buttiauxella warmboldiae TaxID=82993 RepID=A0A3N5DI88_9ENTR|nr:RNA polymerase sigma factor FliA [Buttiauxella warmboldiae]RPH28594.1 RNA polymerase sigma factor FliA [Buttiauxella warmboldiae]
MNGIYSHTGVVQKDELWLKYRFLVRREALRLQVRLPPCVELDDLIQAGALGMLTAIDQFDPKKGISISTYITQRIRWAMIDELRERDWVPRRVRTKAREISTAIQKVEQETGRAASEADVAASMGIALAEYQQMLLDTNTSQFSSLEELQEEFFADLEKPDLQNEMLNPFHELMKGKLVKQISKEIKALPEREQLLLNLYYQQELNMKEVGILLNITETRVSQLHSQAIKRLRARLGADK